MGEIAEMMLDGLLCESCGGVIDMEESGHPRRCASCLADERKEKRRGRHKKNPNTFIMNPTHACEVALKFWLKERSTFNTYSFGWGGPGYVGITLTHDSKPDSDWGRLLGKAGKIICRGEDDGLKAQKMAFEVIRKHLGWPKQEEE